MVLLPPVIIYLSNLETPEIIRTWEGDSQTDGGKEREIGGTACGLPWSAGRRVAER